MKSPKALVCLFAFTMGCGSTVFVHDDDAGAGGTGAHGGDGGSGGITSGGGGEGGTVTGGGGEGGVGGRSCGQTHDYVSITFSNSDGSGFGCDSVEPGTSSSMIVQGAVVETGTNVVAFDTCPPNADCIPSVSRLTVESPSLLMPYLGIGQYIEVSLSVDYPWGCSSVVMVKNLPSWGGSQNQWDNRDTVLLEASEGSYSTFEGSPFSIDAQALGCGTGEDEGCGIAESYDLVFKSNDGSALDLPMGQSGSFLVNEQGGQTLLQARNLKSFETGYCDDYWNWGYWVAQSSLTGGRDH